MQNTNLKNILLVGVVIIVAVCAWVVVRNTGVDRNAEKENEVRALFDGWMKEQKTQYDYVEYKINAIEMMAAKADPNIGVEKEWFPAGASNDAYIASVDFSVRSDTPQDYWFAGNGELDEATGWVNNKFLLVTIDKVNGSYKIINIGTGP